jgi:two-component system, NtrC family, sensor histidine kinase GlrK
MTLQGHIESLLRLNAIASDARRLQHRPLAIDQLIADVVRGRELQIQARKLSVECAVPAATCRLDGEKLQVALDNLLSNAIDFSPEGALIRLEAKIAGQRLQVACIDQGTGVAAEDAERIFEPFVQGRRAPPAPRQGSGIGLSIVRELTSAMGGSVHVVAGEAGSGATFEIELPFER